MIWNFCIERPVLTIVVFLVIGIFGFYGYQSMAVREFPDVEFPVVNVNVVLPGAEPEVIETEVLEPLEEEINTVEGLKALRSTAREEVGTITAEFELWRDVDIAAQDVRDRVNRARRLLPDDIEAPIIQKLDPDAQAILWIALTGNDRWSPVEMTQYAENDIKPHLESIRGVGRVQVGGEKTYAVRIELDPDKLAAHRLTIGDVVRVIQSNNVDIPSGRVEGRNREFLVKTQGQFSGPEPFNDLILTHHDGSPVRLRDVGRAVDGVENERSLARFSGDPSVGLGIVKQSDANTVELAGRIRSRIRQISEGFPPGLTYDIATDDSTYVQENINDLTTTIFIATGLVVLVILFFLRSYWGTLITSIAIPTSLLGGFALIYVFDFSLNVLTMLGLILVIGIVVDDAIVVVESCFRHLEMGADPKPAARTGTTEIAFAAMANTLSLGAVFIPVAFTQGMIGRFFFQFGITVAVTVFASTFTALTLTPMLSSRLLRPPREGGFWGWTERVFGALESVYEAVLQWSLNHRVIVVGIALLAFLLGLWFFNQLPSEFAPSVDKGEFLISFETPEGSTLSYTDRASKKLETILNGVPEIQHYFLAIGLSGEGPGKVNEGIAFVHMSHRSERRRSQEKIMQVVREKMGDEPSFRGFAIEISGATGEGESPLAIELQHQDLQQLDQRKQIVMNWMRSQPEFVGVRSNMEINKPQATVDINRDKALEMGVSVTDISNTLRFLLGQPDISEIERGNERYEVIPEVVGSSRMVPRDLRNLYVRTGDNQLVSLGNLVNVDETVGPSKINHFNRRRSVKISTNIPPGVALGSALDKLRGHLEGSLPPGYDWEVTGQAQDFKESFFYLTVTIVFSVIFIFLVLAGQFESFLHPFTILTTLPLAAAGAFGSLYFLGMTFSIFTFIGLIMLLGLVTKNGILLIDYANVLVERGRGVKAAAEEAGTVRFRPVLMTAVSTILGMMPIALGFGAGGEARAPMGWTVAMGMLAATALTLVVIPVVYTLVDELVGVFRRRPFYSLRRATALALGGFGGWLVWWPFSLGVQGVLRAGFVAVGGFLIAGAAGLFFRLRLAQYGLMIASVVGLGAGVLLFARPDLLQPWVPPVLDLSSTGLLLLGVSLAGLILLWLIVQFERLHRQVGEAT